jgi:hypothetical protein
LRTLPHMCFGTWRGKDEAGALAVFRDILRLYEERMIPTTPAMAGAADAAVYALVGLTGIETAAANAAVKAATHAASAVSFAAGAAVGDVAGGAYAAAGAAQAAASAAEESGLSDPLSSTARALTFAATEDAAAETEQTSIAQLRATSIWRGQDIPEEVASVWSALQNQLLLTDPKWSFWRDWYRGFLDGRPLDWELQRRVALIADGDWDQGPSHVAEVIDEIRARFEVERCADVVAALLAAPDLLLAGIGHNNPLDSIDDLPLSREDVAETERMIARVLQEVRSAKPEKARVAGAAAFIKRTLRAALGWFAKKADMAVDEFAKKFGGYCAAAALPAAALALGQLPRLLDALSDLAKSMEAWLPIIN